MTRAELVEELLVRATDDWLQPADVFDVARFAGDTDEDGYVETALLLVDALLSQGLVVAGDVDGSGFRPWALTVEESISRIGSSWRGDHDAAPGSFGVWLAATPAGLDRSDDALSRRRSVEG